MNKQTRKKIDKLIKFHLNKMQLEMQRFSTEVMELKFDKFNNFIIPYEKNHNIIHKEVKKTCQKKQHQEIRGTVY